ncbi:IS110 family transposase [Mitsuokella sp. WILCCON 0060]|uniref:IS110 family transposase n=1 Tax=unclassified Mitsuokella TaxID=2637239 RepID=UPI003F060DB3
MNCTQNLKISQINKSTLVVGIDIGCTTHYARTFDWRGREIGRVLKFYNCRDQFERFLRYIRGLARENGKTNILVGMEPTGHYWFALGQFLEEHNITLCMVNPYHVKQTKELDDNNQTKNDQKDPKVIAKLVISGRYSYPYVPKGIYADLRILNTMQLNLNKELIRYKNQLARWFNVWFPEYQEVFKNVGAKSSLLLLEKVCTPDAIEALGAEGINAIWREKIRAVGMKRAQRLVDAAKSSIGQKDGRRSAAFQMKMLLSDYRKVHNQLEEVMAELEMLCQQIPATKQMLAIKGIGVRTVVGFLAEVGDIRRFQSPKQIQKLAGLALKENSSGKHRGETTISRRGRARLRTVLFTAAISLISKNEAYQKIHQHFTQRLHNPLKKKQSVVAIGCKLIRIFYTLLSKDVAYDEEKMLKDIVWENELLAA